MRVLPFFALLSCEAIGLHASSPELIKLPGPLRFPSSFMCSAAREPVRPPITPFQFETRPLPYAACEPEGLSI